MSRSPFKYYDQCWVVIRSLDIPLKQGHSAYEHTGNRLLGYMTQVDNTGAFTKRKQTGLTWATGIITSYIHNNIMGSYISRYDAQAAKDRLIEQHSEMPELYDCTADELTAAIDKLHEGEVFDNTPQRGFKIGDSVERYSTSNKLFRVTDPRGFQLEISTSNLAILMRDHVIDKGEIMTECVWVREAANNVLLAVDSEEYRNCTIVSEKIAEQVIPYRDLIKGNVYSLNIDSAITAVYLGKMTCEVEVSVSPSSARWSWGGHAENPPIVISMPGHKQRHCFYTLTGSSRFFSQGVMTRSKCPCVNDLGRYTGDKLPVFDSAYFAKHQFGAGNGSVEASGDYTLDELKTFATMQNTDTIKWDNVDIHTTVTGLTAVR